MRFLLILLSCLAISLTVSWANSSGKLSQASAADALGHGIALRLSNNIDNPALGNKLPAEILRLSPSQRYALLADASKARIYVLENQNGEPHLIRDFYLTIGKNGVGKKVEGDKRTPLGVYTFASALPRSRLTPFYGAGAFPLDYPNAWDKAQGKTGHGIWLHGVPPNVYSRPPKDSDGCLVVTNPDWHKLARYIQPDNTPIVITRRVEWLDRAAWLTKRQALFDTIANWKFDGAKPDDQAYFSHHSRDYLDNPGQSRHASRERDIAHNERIALDLTEMSLFEYGKDPTAVLDFTQSHGGDVTPKQMYMKREDGKWRIVLEEHMLPAPTMTASN